MATRNWGELSTQTRQRLRQLRRLLPSGVTQKGSSSPSEVIASEGSSIEQRRRAALHSVDAKVAALPRIGRLSVVLATADGEIYHGFGTGGMDKHSRFAAGSVTKLFTHALIFALIDQGVLNYSSFVASRVAAGSLDGLHVIGEQDYGAEITVRHLLEHTSGLASWEDTKDPAGRSLVEQIIDWDRVVDVDEQMETAARIGAKFPPGSGRRAYYSDLNAQLLAQVATHTTGTSFEELIHTHIVQPLELSNTSFVRPSARDYSEIATPKHPVWSSRYFSSSPASGGLITSAADLLRFSKAFHNGQLFERGHIQDPVFRRTQIWPIRYGAGMMAIPSLPPARDLLNPLAPRSALIGHAGLPGSFAFYSPQHAAYIVGTINFMAESPFGMIRQYLAALTQ